MARPEYKPLNLDRPIMEEYEELTEQLGAKLGTPLKPAQMVSMAVKLLRDKYSLPAKESQDA